jgi:hypothetical protein
VLTVSGVLSTRTDRIGRSNLDIAELPFVRSGGESDVPTGQPEGLHDRISAGRAIVTPEPQTEAHFPDNP